MKNNRKFNPAIIFIILSIITILLSGLLSWLNIEGTYVSTSEEIQTKVLTINSLFNRTGIQYIVGNMASNFVLFSPLSMVIMGLMSIGILYKSNFLKAIFTAFIKRIPKKVITYILVLLGIISSFTTDAGYIFLLPLAAYIFILNNRNPLIGITATFSGIVFGNGANFLLAGTDASLITITRNATAMTYGNYTVDLYGGIIFMIVSSLILAYIGMLITEKILPNKFEKHELIEEEYELNNSEKRGLRFGLIAVGILILIVTYCIIPNLPFSGLFLDMSEVHYINQLFGSESFFTEGIVFIVSFISIIGSIFYMKGSKKNKDNNYFIKLMGSSLEGIGSIIILVFFASQFIAIFKETNIGPVIVAILGNLIESLEFSPIALIIVVFIVVIISTILLPSTINKWTILAPSVVSSFIEVNLTPEFSLLVYKAADSITRGVTPLLAYFVIYIGFLEIFKDKNTHTISFKRTLGLLLPYSLLMGITWFILIMAFYLVGIPIGIGIFPIL